MHYWIEFYRDRQRQYRWRLRHRNGRVVACSGEGYRRRTDAQRALTRILDAPKEAFRVATVAQPSTAKAAKKKGRRS
jgi:uncharacterized protein YegP (UPF0339 family)